MTAREILLEPLEMIADSTIYCTFTALIRKSLIINGAGEGNRTLMIIQPPKTVPPTLNPLLLPREHFSRKTR